MAATRPQAKEVRIKILATGVYAPAPLPSRRSNSRAAGLTRTAARGAAQFSDPAGAIPTPTP